MFEKAMEDFGVTSSLVSGGAFRRPGGKRFTIGATLYEGVDKNGVEYPPIVDIEDGGIRELERFEGYTSFDEKGGLLLTRLMDVGGAVCSREDIFCDWTGIEITPFIKAFHSKDYGPFRSGNLVDSSHCRGGGISVYFGTRDGGGSFFRWYEKGAQQMEKWAILRGEYQAMHEQAALLNAHIFTASPESRQAKAGSVFSSCIWFKRGYGASKAEGTNNGARCKVHPWWAALLDTLPAAVPFDSADSRETSMEAFLAWVQSSWPRPLAKLEGLLGREGMTQLIGELFIEGQGLLTERDRLEIERWRSCRSRFF